MTWVTLVESSFMSRMYVLDDEFQLSIALAQKALDDTVIPFQRHGRSCDPWVVGEACQEDHWPIHGWPSPWDVWEVPGFKSMTVRVDLNLSLSCSWLTTLLHLRLGCILLMITAVANDGLLRVHGMKEQLGFHCWKAHYEALCVKPIIHWHFKTLTSQRFGDSPGSYFRIELRHALLDPTLSSLVVMFCFACWIWLPMTSCFASDWLRWVWEKIQANADKILATKKMDDVTEAVIVSVIVISFF